jgi:tRNA dimethylallyltransferase
MSERIIVISGPTASGKSDLALEIAASRDIAIINADSLQIYEGLPILSSQPTATEQKKAPHFLYSHFKPQKTSSVGTWLALVKSTVEQVILEKKLPIIVGGSGMYISKLIEGISEIPEISDEIKKEARETYDEIGVEEFSKRIDAELDKQRAIRAYEVLLQTKKPIAFWQDQPTKKIFPNANFLHINLNPPREKLYESCNSRFKIMLKSGALEEVQSLINQGAEDEWPITRTLGFYEIRDFLNDQISQEKMIELSTQKTRNYAKRQLTWFRHQLPQKHVFEGSNAALNFLKNEI